MKNILIFSPTPSHPQNAGNRIRIYNLADHLQALGHFVHFCYYTQEGLKSEQEQAMQKKWNSLTIIKKEMHYKLRGDYYHIDDWYQDNIGSIVSNLCLEKNIDIVLVNYIFQSKLLEYLPAHILKIIDTHDKFTDRHIMMQKNGLQPDFFYTVAEEEKKGLDRADIVLAIQENEAKHFRSLTRKEVIVMPHIETHHDIKLKPFTHLEKIGFIGSGNSVNTKSINLFIDRFIEVLAKKYNVELHIAGSICNKIQIEHPSIHKLGFVESADDFYAQMDLIINPLVLGTGLKIKSVEAIAYGVPIISTDIGFEGLDSASKFHHAKSLEELVGFIEEIYHNPEILEQLTVASRKVFDAYQTESFKTMNSIFEIKSGIDKPTVAIVTHINFWELDLGSRQRLYHLVKFLKQHFHLQIGYTEKKKITDIKKIDALGLLSNVIFLDEMEGNNTCVGSMNMFLSKHKVLSSFSKVETYQKVAQWVEKQHFDAVIIEYLQFSYVLPLFAQSIKILDTHDLMHIRNQTFKAQNMFHWIDITETEELEVFREFDYILSIQQKEHDYCLNKQISSILVPYSYEGTKCQNTKNVKDVIFVGGNNTANLDAICWFIDNVWPLFVNTPLNLVVFGTVCQGVKQKYGRLPHNIYLKGMAKDLTSVYQNASIAINPVKLGGGLKIKNVEALANGLPLITTNEGANGLENGIDSAFLVANSKDEWKNRLIALWLSEELREKLSDNAYAYAQKNFGEKVCYMELVTTIQNRVIHD